MLARLTVHTPLDKSEAGKAGEGAIIEQAKRLAEAAGHPVGLDHQRYRNVGWGNCSEVRDARRPYGRHPLSSRWLSGTPRVASRPSSSLRQ